MRQGTCSLCKSETWINHVSDSGIGATLRRVFGLKKLELCSGCFSEYGIEGRRNVSTFGYSTGGGVRILRKGNHLS